MKILLTISLAEKGYPDPKQRNPYILRPCRIRKKGITAPFPYWNVFFIVHNTKRFAMFVCILKLKDFYNEISNFMNIFSHQKNIWKHAKIC